MSKIFGYKEGHTPSHKGKNLDYEQNSSSDPFMRIKHDVFESRVTQESDGVLTVMDVNQSPCPPMLLRPRPKSPEVLDDYLESTASDPDNHTYKHYVPSLVSVLWNSPPKSVKHSIVHSSVVIPRMSHTRETFLVGLIQPYTCAIIGLVTLLYCELKLWVQH